MRDIALFWSNMLIRSCTVSKNLELRLHHDLLVPTTDLRRHERSRSEPSL